MEYGFNVPVSGPLATPADIATIAQRGEQLGYRLLAIPDHIVVPKTIGSRYPYSKSGEFEVDARAGDHLEPLALMAHLGDGGALSPPGAHGETGFDHRPALARAGRARRRRRLDGGRIPAGRRAGLRGQGARDGRVSADLQDTVDRRRPVVRGRVRLLRRHHVRAEAGSEAASPHLGRWREPAGEAARGPLRRRLVPDRLQPAASARHARPLLGLARRATRHGGD